MAEILASLDDINAEVPEQTAQATDDNTGLIQINAARMIRGNLRQIIDQDVLLSWTVPEQTPEIIRLIAGKLIASQLYFQLTAETTTEIDPNHFSQRLYNEAMTLLNQVIAGSIIIDGITENAGNLTDLDFFPTSSTDRKFTRSMEL